MDRVYLDIYAPLQNFFVKDFDHDLEFFPGIWIIPKNLRPNVQKWNDDLGSHEKCMILSAEYWIHFSISTEERALQGEIVNLFLISLWLVKSSEIHVAFRFQMKGNSKSNNETTYRLLDRFQKYPNSTGDEFSRGFIPLTYGRTITT